MLEKLSKIVILRLLFLVIAMLFVLVMLSAFRNDVVLVISLEESGSEQVLPLKNRRFILGFTHSVMKTRVEDTYELDDNLGLVLTESVYQSYGVGQPFLPDEGELIIEDGVFILKLRREIGVLNLTISPLAGHWLEIDGERFYFSDFLDEDERALSIRAERRP